jgi:magnesium-transporting ATPase (P-type)
MSYARFALMIVTSILVMFGLMYLNTYALDHVQFSQTRMWMAIVMGAAMAIIMIGFMWAMYENRRANIGIVLGSLSVFALALWLVRSQQTVGDVAYMRAMTPHHSIAIMTSERARIRDPEVRQLADRIIQAQVREIDEMRGHIARLEAQPPSPDAPALPSYGERRVPPPGPETNESN